MEEEMNGRFKNDGTDFNQSKDDRKLIYDRLNARQRCQYGLAKNSKYTDNKIANYDDVITIIEEANPSTNIETAYVEFIEHKEIETFIKDYYAAMALFREEHE